MSGIARRRDFAEFDHSAQVRHAGCGAQHDGHTQLVREPECRDGHILHFLSGGGCKQRQAEQAAVMTVILFVLAGKQTGVVGIVDDQRALDADIGQRAERIGGHVQPDVLHGSQAVQTGHGRACGSFHGDFFIGSEFHAEGRMGLELEKQCANFGRRSPRIGAGKIESGFIGAPYQSFIAHEENFPARCIFQ